MYSSLVLPWLLLFCLGYLTGGSRADLAEMSDSDHFPVTAFSCQDKVIGGYYADVESHCQMFHVCTFGQKGEVIDIKFLCVSGSVFDQKTRVCERVDEVDCSQSTSYYHLNLELYGRHNQAAVHRRQGRKYPADGDRPSSIDSMELEDDYDDYDMMEPIIDMHISMTEAPAGAPTTTDPPTTAGTTSSTIPTPVPTTTTTTMETPIPTPVPTSAPATDLVPVPTPIENNIATQASPTTDATTSPAPDLWNWHPAERGSAPEADGFHSNEVPEDQDVLELLEQIRGDVPRISSIRRIGP